MCNNVGQKAWFTVVVRIVLGRTGLEKMELGQTLNANCSSCLRDFREQMEAEVASLKRKGKFRPAEARP